MEVSFQHLCCTPPFSKRKLLHEVSGRFLPGELTAILGPSGAGKTTLLNALSGYRRSGVSGHISAGSPRSKCYIGQEDLLAPFLTAGELMEFAGRLKLPASFTSKKRAVVVDEILSSLGLEVCINTRTERLSGGQRKRLCIALELINNPPILFLDEPTSGLDIVSATQLIHLLSGLSRKGRTIVITIHQPSAKLFNLFDQVYFLARGKCVYQGGPGPHLIQFLANYDFICPCHYNPADYLIEVVEVKTNIEILSEASENGKISWYCKEIKGKSPEITDYRTNVFSEKTSKNSLASKMAFGEQKSDCISIWTQFIVILGRIMLQTKRNRTGMKLQLIHYIICALMLSSLYYQTANDGSLFNGHFKFCLSVVVFHCYTHQMAPVVYYPLEVKLLRREHFNQWYTLLPYYMAFKISKIPYMLFLILVYSSLVYGLVGLPWELDRFALFYATGIALSFISESFGMTIGALFNVTVGATLGAVSLAPFLSLAIYGFDFLRSIPPFMKVISTTSFMRSGSFAFLLIMYGFDRKQLDCPDDVDHCHFRDPKTALHFLNLEESSVWEPYSELFVNMCFYWLTFYLALKWRLRR